MEKLSTANSQYVYCADIILKKKKKRSPRKEKHQTYVLSLKLMKFSSHQDFSQCWYHNLRKPFTTAYSIYYAIYSIYYYQNQWFHKWSWELFSYCPSRIFLRLFFCVHSKMGSRNKNIQVVIKLQDITDSPNTKMVCQ